MLSLSMTHNRMPGLLVAMIVTAASFDAAAQDRTDRTAAVRGLYTTGRIAVFAPYATDMDRVGGAAPLVVGGGAQLGYRFNSFLAVEGTLLHATAHGQGYELADTGSTQTQ